MLGERPVTSNHVTMAALKVGGWDPFTPKEAAEVMKHAGARWWVSGGWAIDLCIGHQTRPHDDIDIGVFRSDQAMIRHFFANWDVVIASSRGLRPWPAGKWLVPPTTTFGSDTIQVARGGSKSC
jgi:hypothetical protein